MKLVSVGSVKLPVWALVVGALGLACEDEPASAERVCIPGTTQLCNGPGRCAGVQSCLDSGEGHGVCDCGPTPSAAAVEPGPVCSEGERRVCYGEAGCGGVQVCGANGQFADCDCSVQSLAVNTFGTGCEVDTDCGPDLECWSASAEGRAAFVGGAAHGYCTRTCRLPQDCTGLDPRGVCSTPGADGAGVCLRACLSKDPLSGEAKCLDRVDQICLSTAALGLEPFSTTTRQNGACLPNCGSDEDCSGRVCDLASGYCVDQPATGLAIGAACSVESECAGRVCSAFPSGARFCTAPCAFTSLGCGYASDANPRGASCAVSWFNEGGVTEGRQDLGLCIELCNTSADCAQPDFACDTSQGGPPGSAGACIPEADLASGNAGADAGSGADMP